MADNPDLPAWETNADNWDSYMGDESNVYHRELVRPWVTALLDPRPGDRVLDVACGNGNYSRHLAGMGARVTAFDFSPRMVELARRRGIEGVDYRVIDATDRAQIGTLTGCGPFDRAVSNMAFMDMSDLSALLGSMADLLVPGGCFVFATQHPCFVTLTDLYLTPHTYPGYAVPGQPVPHNYHHRSLQDLLGQCFDAGFAVDALKETGLPGDETPKILIVRLRRIPRKDDIPASRSP